MSKRVTFVQLHDGFFIPGVGSFDKSASITSKTLKDYKIMLEDSGNLTLTWTEGHFQKEIMIAAATVKVVLLEPVKLGDLKEVKTIELVQKDKK